MNNLMQHLNPEQLDAVKASESDLLILAGAGSGKTRVLTYRITWLLNQNLCSPFNILAVTFTNKAANEMRARVESLVGDHVNSMWIGTFHSLAHRILRLHWEDAKLPRNFQIIDSEDQYRIIRRLLKKLNLDEEHYPPRKVQSCINHYKNDGKRSKCLNPFDHFGKIILQIYESYESDCSKNGLVDFAELLLCTQELLLNNVSVLQHYRQKFKHVLIDEFQDTNAIQYAWIRLLSSENNYVTVVGDDDQSIYSWRGAKVKNIRAFQNDFPNAKIVHLTRNYRSTKIILKAANSLISKNTNRMGKKLWSDDSTNELISVYHAFNDIDEARFIVGRILVWVDKGNNLKDCAVLYRSNAQSRVIEDELLKMNVSYSIYGGLRFFERAEIKDALAYLRLIDSRDNDVAFERIINTPTRGIGRNTVLNVRQFANQNNISMWQAAKQLVMSDKQILKTRAHNAMGDFLNLIDECSNEIKSLDLARQIDKVLNASGLLDYYKNQKGEKSRTRVENLRELISAASEFEIKTVNDDLPVLSDFLTHTALESGGSKSDSDVPNDSVKLMTLHSVKGLEFPVVFISGLEEGLLPHVMSSKEPDQLEEERRLCYVGITRAMRKLYLTNALRRRIHGKNMIQRPSRFLSEIARDCLQEIRFKVPEKQVSFDRFYPRRNRIQNKKHDSGFMLGQTVSHSKFGEGVILNFDGEGCDARVHVEFKKVGVKCLSIRYAKLTGI